MIESKLFVSLVLIIFAATITYAIMKKLKQPSMFSYILAGILIGPLVIGGMDFSWLNLPFQIGIKEITPEIQLLSELGAAFLLFTIGIDTSVKRLLNMGKPLIIGMTIQVLATIAISVALTVGLNLLTYEQALFVGSIIAFSSTMVIIKILADSKKVNTLSGRIIIAMSLIQDFLIVLVVPLLQNTSQISNPIFFIPIFAKSALLIIIALFANKYIFQKLFDAASKENELFFLCSISTALAFISLSTLLEVPITIGAFIGGISLNNTPYNTAIFSKIRALRDFFLTIFFVSLGIQLNMSFAQTNILLAAIILVIILLIKPLIFFIITLFSGYGSRIGLEAGLSLSQASEFGFILSGIALSLGIFQEELFSLMITITAASMIIGPYLTSYAPSFSNKVTEILNKKIKIDKIKIFNKRINVLRNIPSKRKLNNHIIIIGSGLIGREIAEKMKEKHEVLLIDSDPEVVTQGQVEGLPIVYGTSEDTELLDNLDLPQAKLVIITMANHAEAISFVKIIKKESPKTIIFATSAHYYDTKDFYEKETDFVFMPIFTGIDSVYKKIEYYKRGEKVFKHDKEKIIYQDFIKKEAEKEIRYKKKMMGG